MTQFIRVATVRVDLTKEFYPGQLLNYKPGSYTGVMELSNLRIAFTVQKNIGWATNSASLSIWNLSTKTRNRLKDFGDKVTISAGYEQEIGPQILFIGDSSTLSHVVDTPEIVTTIDCADGERILMNNRINVSYDPGTTVEYVIRDMAAKMNLPIIEIQSAEGKVYEFGFSYEGIGREGLRKAFEKAGLVGSVQNTGLHVIDPNIGSSRPPFIISPESGMIGIPQRYTNRRRLLFTQGLQTGWIVRTVLNAQIIPGDRIQIISTRADIKGGTFIVISIKHTGDTYGDSWFSELEVILLR